MYDISKEIINTVIFEDELISQKLACKIVGCNKYTLQRNKQKFGARRNVDNGKKGKLLKYSLKKILEYVFEKKRINELIKELKYE